MKQLYNDETQQYENKYNFDDMRDEVIADLPEMELAELQAMYKMLVQLSSSIAFEMAKRKSS